MVLGGATRRQSVFNALKRIENCAYVVIHDGVRPFVTPQIIARTIRAVKKFGAVTCAVQAKDTMAEAKKYSIDSVLYRNMIWHLQTPQAFKLNLIYQAHRIANSRKNFDPSDDTQLLLMLNQRVKIVEGSYENIKVTTHFDFDLVKLILQHRNKSQEK